MLPGIDAGVSTPHADLRHHLLSIAVARSVRRITPALKGGSVAAVNANTSGTSRLLCDEAVKTPLADQLAGLARRRMSPHRSQNCPSDGVLIVQVLAALGVHRRPRQQGRSPTPPLQTNSSRRPALASRYRDTARRRSLRRRWCRPRAPAPARRGRRRCRRRARPYRRLCPARASLSAPASPRRRGRAQRIGAQGVVEQRAPARAARRRGRRRAHAAPRRRRARPAGRTSRPARPSQRPAARPTRCRARQA